LHWLVDFEGSIQTVTLERMLLDARSRVANAHDLQHGDDEEPSAGDTAAVPPTQRVFSEAMMKESNVGDTTSAQLAANG
jgi:hypothetical protein